MGCQSGPTQKIEQHFKSVHGFPVKSAANYRLRKFKMALTREAIALRLPNPHARYTIGTGRTIGLAESAAGPSRRPRQISLDVLVGEEAEGGSSKGAKGSCGFKGDGRKGKGRAGSAGGGGVKGKGKGRAGGGEGGGRMRREAAGGDV